MSNTVVLIPAGPGEDGLSDTIDSIETCLSGPHRIVVVDDTGEPGRLRRELGSHIAVVPAPQDSAGGFGGLYVKLCAGMRFARSNFSFDLLLRFDVDALMLNERAVVEARRRFAEDRALGMLGALHTGPDGGQRDWEPAAAALRRESGLLGLRRPGVRALLREARQRAGTHGYVDGEHCLGGAYFLTRAAVDALDAGGWLDQPGLSRSRLGEDHLFTLFLRAGGLRAGEFSRPGDPMALRWRGLPAHPDDLLRTGASITHSIRSWEDLDEIEIRSAFRAARHPSR